MAIEDNIQAGPKFEKEETAGCAEAIAHICNTLRTLSVPQDKIRGLSEIAQHAQQIIVQEDLPPLQTEVAQHVYRTYRRIQEFPAIGEQCHQALLIASILIAMGTDRYRSMLRPFLMHHAEELANVPKEMVLEEVLGQDLYRTLYDEITRTAPATKVQDYLNMAKRFTEGEGACSGYKEIDNLLDASLEAATVRILLRQETNLPHQVIGYVTLMIFARTYLEHTQAAHTLPKISEPMQIHWKDALTFYNIFKQLCIYINNEYELVNKNNPFLLFTDVFFALSIESCVRVTAIEKWPYDEVSGISRTALRTLDEPMDLADIAGDIERSPQEAVLAYNVFARFLNLYFFLKHNNGDNGISSVDAAELVHEIELACERALFPTASASFLRQWRIALGIPSNTSLSEQDWEARFIQIEGVAERAIQKINQHAQTFLCDMEPTIRTRIVAAERGRKPLQSAICKMLGIGRPDGPRVIASKQRIRRFKEALPQGSTHIEMAQFLRGRTIADLITMGISIEGRNLQLLDPTAEKSAKWVCDLVSSLNTQDGLEVISLDPQHLKRPPGDIPFVQLVVAYSPNDMPNPILLEVRFYVNTSPVNIAETHFLSKTWQELLALAGELLFEQITHSSQLQKPGTDLCVKKARLTITGKNPLTYEGEVTTDSYALRQQRPIELAVLIDLSPQHAQTFLNCRPSLQVLRTNAKPSKGKFTVKRDLRSLNSKVKAWRNARENIARQHFTEAGYREEDLAENWINQMENIISMIYIFKAANLMAPTQRRFIFNYLVESNNNQLDIILALYGAASVLTYTEISKLIAERDVFSQHQLTLTASQEIPMEIIEFFLRGHINLSTFYRIRNLPLMRQILRYLER